MMRGRPFELGNKFGKGRPLGSHNKINDAARKLLDEHGVALIRRCIAAAHRGDMKALHILIDRLLPRKLPTPRLKLSSGFETSQHIGKAYNEIMHAIANGKAWFTTILPIELLRSLAGAGNVSRAHRLSEL